MFRRTWPLLSALVLGCGGVAAQTAPPPFSVDGARVSERIQGVLALLGLQVIPDVTTTSLSITDDAGGNPDLTLSQLGAGFTWGDDLPLYLEGMVAYSRYDPQFLATDGQTQRRLPLKWNSFAATIGVGWDFHLTEKLVLRPIATATIAYVATDAKFIGFLVNDRLNAEVEFLKNGGLNAWGYGASLALDYADYNERREIDIELRYSFMRLETYGGVAAVAGTSDVANLNLWMRWRAPISDWTLFEKPVRYVVELTHSEFLGDQRGILGFDRLTSLGTGLELEVSESGVFDRARMMGRYVFGENVSGFSIGFAVTF